MGRIWRLQDIDPNNPEERFLPALQCIPLGPGMQRLVLPEAMARWISKHMSECGCPPIDPELAVKDYLPPRRGQNHPLNASADWVTPGTPAPDPFMVQDPESLTVHEREAQIERYRHMGYKVEKIQPEPSTLAAVDALDDPPRFDPTTHTVTEVCAYLRELGDSDPVERGRVLYQEKHNRKRNGILRRFT